MQRISSCTAQLDSGEFCDAPSMEDVPFPICKNHALELFRHMRADTSLTFEWQLEQLQSALGASRADMPEVERRMTAMARAQSVVYYVRMRSGRIKIGFSTAMKNRVAALRVDPGQVLATEPGGRDLERARHEQFADLRYDRWEEFRADERLMSHIARVREANGPPDITRRVSLADVARQVRDEAS